MSGASTMLFTFTLDRGITWEVVQYLSLCVNNSNLTTLNENIELIVFPVCKFNARG